jgi:hypothetical protein
VSSASSIRSDTEDKEMTGMGYKGTNKQAGPQAGQQKQAAALAPKEMPKAAAKPPKPEPVKPEDLPLVSVVASRATMDELIELMQADVHLAEEIKAMTDAREANKGRIKQMLLEEDLPGVRYGSLYAKLGEEEVKRTLDKGLIALNFGIDLDELDRTCYKESRPFRKLFIDDLTKPRRGKAAGSEE